MLPPVFLVMYVYLEGLDISNIQCVLSHKIHNKIQRSTEKKLLTPFWKTQALRQLVTGKKLMKYYVRHI